MKEKIFQMKLRIYGLVQGVGFRFFTQRQAQRLGVRGFVRNTDKGEVEVEAYGSKAVLEEFFAVVKKGPLYSRVERVECEYLGIREDEKPKKEFYIQS